MVIFGYNKFGCLFLFMNEFSNEFGLDKFIDELAIYLSFNTSPFNDYMHYVIYKLNWDNLKSFALSYMTLGSLRIS